MVSGDGAVAATTGLLEMASEVVAKPKLHFLLLEVVSKDAPPKLNDILDQRRKCLLMCLESETAVQDLRLLSTHAHMTHALTIIHNTRSTDLIPSSAIFDV